MEEFDYLKPGSLQEAVGILARNPGEAKVLAGGQSLMPLLKEGLITPRLVVNLAGIEGLRLLLWHEDEGLTIGAMVTQRELETSSLVREKCPALSEAVSRVASVPVRNLGTLAGNLCHAAPGADPPAILIALGALVEIYGNTGDRTIPVEDLFAGPYETVLADGEVISQIRVPPLPAAGRAAYLKHSVRAIDPAIVGVGAMVAVQDGLVREARIGIVGAGPRPLRLRGAEEALTGQPLEDSVMRKAAQVAAGETEPLTDSHASAEYRQKMVPVFVRRALERIPGLS